MKYSDSQVSGKRKPGAVRDAIMETLAYRTRGATVAEIAKGVSDRIGQTAASSVRSYLRLNTPKLFRKIDRGHYVVREEAQTTLAFANGAQATPARGAQITSMVLAREAFRFGNATLIHADCFDWLAKAPTNSVQAVVTDPPYGLVEYSEREQDKLRQGRGGVWRIPPSFDGNKRAPLPRFTVLTHEDLGELERFS